MAAYLTTLWAVSAMQEKDLDAVLAHIEEGRHLDERCVVMLLAKLAEVLYEEPNLLVVQAPITICGDIHGQLYDLFELFVAGGAPATTQYLFQGDYVDRGLFSLETYLYLAALMLKYPRNAILLRGHRERRRVLKVLECTPVAFNERPHETLRGPEHFTPHYSV